MKLLSLKTPIVNSKVLVRLSVVTAVAASLSGCLLTSPFWNQVFSSRTTNVPLQAFTTDNSKNITFQCAHAFHGGLHPSENTAIWTTVTTVTPASTGAYDSNGTLMYSASASQVLPAVCWRQDGNGQWYSAIRAQQGSGSSITTYNTFTQAGLECLGTEVGKAANWLAWIGKGCAQTYSNNNNPIPYVIFRAPA